MFSPSNAVNFSIRLHASRVASLIFGLPLLASHFLLHHNQLSYYLLTAHALMSLAIWRYCHVRYAALTHPKAITGIQLKQSQFYLTERNQTVYPARLLEHSYIRPGFYLLYFKPLPEQEHEIESARFHKRFLNARYRFVFIFPYNSNSFDALRRLRMFALHGKQAPPSSLLEPMD